MRRAMRECFDDLWILDLGGEGRGARRSENVFDIQTPVAIAIGVRSGELGDDEPARVHYARVDGTREEKYTRLDAIASFADVDWEPCFPGWAEPFLPHRAGDYFSWPALTDLFPWQHSGAQFKRTWPIAPDRATLERRWYALLSGARDERAELFRETRDRKVDRSYDELPSIASLPADAAPPASVAYGYRSLDRQYCLADARLGDFLRPPLWQAHGPRQLFLSSLLRGQLGDGPAATVTHLIPDLDHFRGSFGGKNVIPLWRDAAATTANVHPALGLDPEELFAYCVAILSAPGYTTRFAAELELPGPRIPLTRDGGLFRQGAELGRRVVWLETLGERMAPAGQDPGVLPPGRARNTVAVGTTEDDYPASHSYDADARRLLVGGGSFEPVDPEVRAFSVSGLDVIGSWLDYRMREGAGRRSSQLDRIRPPIWPAAFTEELLRLLWAVEGLVALGPELDRFLAAAAAGAVLRVDELPEPPAELREAP